MLKNYLINIFIIFSFLMMLICVNTSENNSLNSINILNDQHMIITVNDDKDFNLVVRYVNKNKLNICTIQKKDITLNYCNYNFLPYQYTKNNFELAEKSQTNILNSEVYAYKSLNDLTKASRLTTYTITSPLNFYDEHLDYFKSIKIEAYVTEYSSSGLDLSNYSIIIVYIYMTFIIIYKCIYLLLSYKKIEIYKVYSFKNKLISKLYLNKIKISILLLLLIVLISVFYFKIFSLKYYLIFFIIPLFLYYVSLFLIYKFTTFKIDVKNVKGKTNLRYVRNTYMICISIILTFLSIVVLNVLSLEKDSYTESIANQASYTLNKDYAKLNITTNNLNQKSHKNISNYFESENAVYLDNSNLETEELNKSEINENSYSTIINVNQQYLKQFTNITITDLNDGEMLLLIPESLNTSSNKYKEKYCNLDEIATFNSKSLKIENCNVNEYGNVDMYINNSKFKDNGYASKVIIKVLSNDLIRADRNALHYYYYKLNNNESIESNFEYFRTNIGLDNIGSGKDIDSFTNLKTENEEILKISQKTIVTIILFSSLIILLVFKLIYITISVYFESDAKLIFIKKVLGKTIPIRYKQIIFDLLIFFVISKLMIIIYIQLVDNINLSMYYLMYELTIMLFLILFFILSILNIEKRKIADMLKGGLSV